MSQLDFNVPIPRPGESGTWDRNWGLAARTAYYLDGGASRWYWPEDILRPTVMIVALVEDDRRVRYYHLYAGPNHLYTMLCTGHDKLPRRPTRVCCKGEATLALHILTGGDE